MRSYAFNLKETAAYKLTKDTGSEGGGGRAGGREARSPPDIFQGGLVSLRFSEGSLTLTGEPKKNPFISSSHT